MHAGVPTQYIGTYNACQTGVVVEDQISKLFDIKRDTRQGDRISPPLFNCVLERIFWKVKPTWEAKKMGTIIETGQLLQDLRFADDVLIVVKSLREVELVLQDLFAEFTHAGSEIQPSKTNILSNQTRRSGGNAAGKKGAFSMLLSRHLYCMAAAVGL